MQHLDLALKLYILEQILLISAGVIFISVRLIKYFRARRRRQRNIDDRISELEEKIFEIEFPSDEKKRTTKKSRFQ